MSELKDKLQSEIMACSWSMLSDHHQRGALFVVSAPLTLAQVGQALALDQVEEVKNWQNQQWLRAPLESEISRWKEQANKEFATFLIISPFVLIRPKNPA